MSQEWPGIFLDAHDVKLFDKSRGKDWRVTRVHQLIRVTAYRRPTS